MNIRDIKSPADIKSLGIDELKDVASQIRSALLDKLSHYGGHIGPNLGMVEMTIALHYVFNSPIDKFVFDVSHQSYAHKMLTGRVQAFLDASHYGDVSGYTNPAESPHDHFTIGHTSTSVALAGGLAVARDMKHESSNIISIIGDGSLSGGEAFEGLDFGATLRSNFIVIVNDNDMSIAENHGGIYGNLAQLRQGKGKADTNLFTAMGYDYRYLDNGNDLSALIDLFKEVKDYPRPIILHIKTIKGMGYAPAEEHKEMYHWNLPFDLTTGAILGTPPTETYASIFTEHMLQKMQQDATVAVITAGTPGVIGFTPEKRQQAGSQFIDVGIAEQDAVALASGMAKGGARPCFGVVSSFIQRAYDQLSQDVAINSNAAVLSIFAGTIAGMNDVTHLGWFDIPLISNIPGWVFLAPTNAEEYLAMLDWAMSQRQYPVAVRVPGGKVLHATAPVDTDYSKLNTYSVVRRGSKVAIIGAGAFLSLAEATADALNTHNINATVINPRYLSGIDTSLLDELKSDHTLVITLEDGALAGGFGEKIAAYYGTSTMRVKCYGAPDRFIDRYNARDLLRECHLAPDLLSADIIGIINSVD
jgi:1-deoxy-D-xylulose-5-phosphate synthase